MKQLAHLPIANKFIWIFGYGSLVHTPNFSFSSRVTGYIRGYRRVFWQGSTDHRGTPQRPGRTATLTADPAATTWGVAYQLAGTREEQLATLSYLEWREKQYDVRELVDVYGQDNAVTVSGALVYIANPANSNYLGPASLDNIAQQIATSRGPSGPNCEYLFKLADAMRAIGVQDSDLYGLEELVRHELARHSAGMAEEDADRSESHGQTTGVLSAGLRAEAREYGGVEAESVVGFDDGHEYRRWHQLGQAQQGVATVLSPVQTPVTAGQGMELSVLACGPVAQQACETEVSDEPEGHERQQEASSGVARAIFLMGSSASRVESPTGPE